MVYDNMAARKGQALAVHTAIARGEENNAKFIYKNFIYYLTLADVVQGSDADLIQKVIDNKDFDKLVNEMKEGIEMTHYDKFREEANECRRKITDMMCEVITDTMQVFDFGAAKHPDSGDTPNFLTPNGNKCSKHERGSSILRHAARTFMQPDVLDKESGLPELLHLLASVSIMYIRTKRDIVHMDDESDIMKAIRETLEDLRQSGVDVDAI